MEVLKAAKPYLLYKLVEIYRINRSRDAIGNNHSIPITWRDVVPAFFFM